VEHFGLDLSATLTQVVAMDATGVVTRRLRVPTVELPAWLGSQPPARVVMEACTQSPMIARAARAAKHEAIVIPGQAVRALGVGARGIKTDDRDAEVLAQASVRSVMLPSVHLRSETARSSMQLIAVRSMLVRSRAQCTLFVKSWLRGMLIRVTQRATGGRFAAQVRELAQKRSMLIPPAIEVLLSQFESLTERIEALDAQLEVLAETSELCQLLMTMPGVGPVCAAMFTAHVDDLSRFPTSEHLASYLGLVPGEATTSFKIVRTSTIKAGPKYLRAQLVQSAWSLWNARPNEPIVLWAQGIAAKKGKRIAIVALARKIATILYAMWKTQTKYDPSRPSTVRRGHPPA
jgi:transposase